jgi:hypothetical protein
MRYSPLTARPSDPRTQHGRKNTEQVGLHDIGGIPERGGQGISRSALMTRATFSRLASAWRETARFMRGRRDPVDRAVGVLDRHDRFRRVGHPEVGDADTHTALACPHGGPALARYDSGPAEA